MTPTERAEDIVRRFIPAHLMMAVRTADLMEAIRIAIVENATQETNRARNAENLLDGMRAGVILVCDEHGTRLKAWNHIRQAWAEAPMAELRSNI